MMDQLRPKVFKITPTLNPKVPQSTQSSGFTTGRLINKIDISRTDNTIKSIHLNQMKTFTNRL